MKNKYNAKKTEYFGILFDSKKEAERYKQLVELEDEGIITDLRRQVPFILQKEYINGEEKKIREIKYIADFVYKRNGITHVEDVKGIILPEFKLKKKLFDYVYYPLTIEIVK